MALLSMEDKVKKKMRSDDRILILKLMDDKLPISSTGLIDRRLFTGETKLHATRDTQTSLWYFWYDHGELPQALNQRFTKFDKLMNFATEYFGKRNIIIKEVID